MDAADSNASRSPPDILRMLGLSNTERRAYELLLRTGPATPTVVARETGQSRGRIYETLRLLVEKGLAFEAAGRPVRYSPVTLSQALGLALEETVRRSELLRNAFQNTVALAPPKPEARKPELGPVAVLSGRRAVLSEVTRLLAHAREYFVVAGTSATAQRFVNHAELVHELRKARERGVVLQFRIPRDPLHEEARGRLIEEIGPAALLEIPPGHASPVITVGTEHAFLVSVARPDNPSPVQGEDAALRLDDVDLREATRAQMSGPTAAHVPFTAIHPEGLQLLEEQLLDALGQAQSEIVFLGPRGWTRMLEKSWGPLLSAYAASKARGVRFRALAEDVPEERALLEKFGPIWDIRTTWWVPGWLTIVDRKVIFEVFTPREPGDKPHLRQSADAQEIRYYLGIFERLWAQARVLPTAAPRLAESERGPQPA